MITLLDVAIVLVSNFLMLYSSLSMTGKYNSILGKIVEVRKDGVKVVQLNAEARDGRGVRIVVIKDGVREEFHCATREQIEDILSQSL